MDGVDHVPWYDDCRVYLSEMEEFLTGDRSDSMTDRVLATVLFSDIVDSTKRAEATGDRAWRDLLDADD